MLLTFVVILLVIWASVVWSIYSGFLTFYRSFDETENYNKAYYASIWALERAELAIRQRWPWYEWDWWRQDWASTWSSLNEEVNIWDGINNSSWLSYLNFNPTSNLFWSIKAKTSTIPSKWNWDVDWTIFSWDSIDYNKMDYENAEIFLLYYDSGSNSPYNSGQVNIQQSRPSGISWTLRLPETVKEKFWQLDTNQSLSTIIKNDPIVDWQIRWKYQWEQFTIYSFSHTNIDERNNPASQILRKDSVIRESDINSWSNGNNINFGSSSKSPVSKKWGNDTNPERTIISSKDAEISGNASNFNKVFNNYTWLQLRMSLLNLLKTWDVVYPYLEYKLNFWEPVTDKYYTIDAEWKLWDYKVNLIVQKPTIRESVYWNFTVIF